MTRVYPVDDAHPAGPYYWDVSSGGCRRGTGGADPLRLVFYSTDGDYHSGRYFWDVELQRLGRDGSACPRGAMG